MKVRTGGYGGRKIRERVQVRTNDPKKPIMEIVVAGEVEMFARINPEHVHFMGNAGEPMAVEVEIVPRKEYPFTVTSVKSQNEGGFIKFELKEKCTKGGGRCILRVENTRAEKGRYVDRLLIHTDSPLRPVIAINVSGAIL